ncbi:MAG: hypothetical protein ABI877_13715 [Gemmatimonadaceae bacterium]
MYSTCIFCNKPLGSNESLEAFPVGERLAFDPARGRLWVVCRACERWNLSPLEERWEAIEQAERLYRDTKRRVSTENIGLAQLPQGTTLVRIGEPQRPEFAAWRYGDQFGRRRVRALLAAGGGVAVVAALVTGGAIAGVGIGGFGYLFVQAGRYLILGSPETIVARIRIDQQLVVHVRRRHLAESSIAAAEDGTLGLQLRFKNGSAHFSGPEAERIASIILPKVNRYGGRKTDVADAVRQIEDRGDSARYLRDVGRQSHGLIRSMTEGVSPRKAKARQSEFTKYGLFSLPAAQRLALEMALHEEAERRALEGELAELEQAWVDAEEVAAISDNLLVPETVDAQFRKLKGEG